MHFFQGPWVQDEALNQYNGMLRYTVDRKDWGMAVNGKAYRAHWTATNQIPARAVESGLLSRYGTMDPSDGGTTDRYSLSGTLWSRGDTYRNELNLYAVYYDLDLYSNFTGYLDDPVHGDQINQHERRVVAGGNGEQTFSSAGLGWRWTRHWDSRSAMTAFPTLP